MQFSTLLLLASSCIAAPLTPRSAVSIDNAISGIESKLATLNGTLNTFALNLFTIPTVLKIEEQVAELGDAVKAATAAANQSPALSDADSGTVATAVVNLVPQIKSLLSNIVAHKSVFDKAILGFGSVSPQVEYDLQNQSKLSDDFSTALIAKLSPTYAGFAPLITNQIKGAFSDAIAAFSHAGGLFQLPVVKNLGEFEELLKKYLHL